MWGCASKRQGDVVSIQLIDRNGLNETIGNPERIARLQNIDFLASQPYQKVVRVFKRDMEGRTASKLTTYHENGMPWQYLETIGGRAKGVYREWYANGQQRMEAEVIEGIGDLTLTAQSSWVFDHVSRVWSEEGNLLAEISYNKGSLSNHSTYYHPNGAISKIIPYRMNQIEGVMQFFNEMGVLIGSTNYVKGVKEGVSEFKGNEHLPAREEEYQKGLLVRGKYWDMGHGLIGEIVNGSGIKPIFENGVKRIEQQYVSGVPEGKVTTYRENGSLESIYHISHSVKQGEEWCYYEKRTENETLQPMLFINWKDDEITGLVRTWYPNGNLESEKEMSHNKKDGLLLAWYEDGSMAMVEEYRNDLLSTGKYMKKNEDQPVSRVIGGKGTATIFDKDGNFVRKIEYRKGQPVE